MAAQKPTTSFFVSYRAFLLLLMLVFFALDQWIKSLVLQEMTLGESIPLWSQVFHLTYLENSGAAFSLLQEHPEFLTGMSSLFFLGFFVYAMTRRGLTRLEFATFALVLGGALGNLWDRFSRGQVVDYLDLTIINYPVFNLADSFIFCGIVLLIIQTFKKDNDDDENREKRENTEEIKA